MVYNKFFDAHLTLSTLGSIASACVPIFVSYVAYCVTRTQRDISANQYKLDLYTKRRDIYDDLNNWCTKNTNCAFALDELAKLNSITLDVEILFSIKNNIIKNNINNIVELNNNIIKMTFFGPENNKKREHEITLDEGNIAALWWEILEEMQNYHKEVKESLRVPQNPY